MAARQCPQKYFDPTLQLLKYKWSKMDTPQGKMGPFPLKIGGRQFKNGKSSLGTCPSGEKFSGRRRLPADF